MGQSDPEAPILSQKAMISLCVKFQPYHTPPSDRFWWGVLVLYLLVVVTGVKQSQLLVLKPTLEFDNKFKSKNSRVDRCFSTALHNVHLLYCTPFLAQCLVPKGGYCPTLLRSRAALPGKNQWKICSSDILTICRILSPFWCFMLLL